MNIQILNKMVDREVLNIEKSFKKNLYEIDKELCDILTMARAANDVKSLEYVFVELKSFGSQIRFSFY